MIPAIIAGTLLGVLVGKLITLRKPPPFDKEIYRKNWRNG